MSSSCLSDSILAGMVEGNLSDSERQYVSEHVDECAACRGLAAGMVLSVFRAGQQQHGHPNEKQAAVQETKEPLPPTEIERIGNYRILRKIGEGGMGEVFEAVHEKIRRRVAIKILRSQYSQNKNIVGRFFNEALAANVIQHQSLVGIFEAGFLSTGSAFLIMEYLHGETLFARLQRLGPMNEIAAYLIGRQISSALAAAHAQEIVHRDLKTENIMLIQDADVIGGLRAKVLDFGLAKIAVRHQAHAVLTKDGLTMGTRPYMAPEQWLSAGSVDSKADVYALGVALFEMLSGRYPFLGPSTSEYMNQHLYEPPSSLASVCTHASAAGAALVAGMLEKKRSMRPSMDQVVATIEGILISRRVLAVSPPELRTPSLSAHSLKAQADLDVAQSFLSLNDEDLQFE